MEFIPVQFNKISQSQAYTVFILGTDRKQFAIYTAPHVGQNLQSHFTKQSKPRPYTSDLINAILQGLQIKILQVVIYDVRDTIYYARLFIEQRIDERQHILEIDARPSDCLVLAIENDIPIYCAKDTFDRVIPVEE